MALSGHMQWLEWFCIAVCVVLGALGFSTGRAPYFLFMVLPLLVACTAHRTAPHVLAASQALRVGRRSGGLVEIPSAGSPRQVRRQRLSTLCANWIGRYSSKFRMA